MSRITAANTSTDLEDEKLELNLEEWDYIAEMDEVKDMKLSHEKEIEFLGSESANLAAYLKLHPEMAHELMVPPGRSLRLLRRYERYLDGDEPLSARNGDRETARWNAEIFDAMLPGFPKILVNPKNESISWRELNEFVCKSVKNRADGLRLAPHYEYINTGERVRIIDFKSARVEVTAREWHIMGDHVVWQFQKPTTPGDIEFASLHAARVEILNFEPRLNDMKFSTGQEIAIIIKQLEHRLRFSHIGRRHPSISCPFDSGPPKLSKDGTKFQQYLSKAEATELVCDEIAAQKPSKLPFVNYDPLIRSGLEKRGLKSLLEDAKSLVLR